MVAPMVSHKATHINRLDEGGIPWLAMLLGMSIVVFFFQLFPSVWWSGVSFVLYLLSYLDALRLDLAFLCRCLLAHDRGLSGNESLACPRQLTSKIGFVTRFLGRLSIMANVDSLIRFALWQSGVAPNAG